MKIKVITSAKKGSIVQQYIDFSRRYDEFTLNKNFSEKSVLKFIDKCIREKILSEFLSKNRREIMSIMSVLYDQDVVDKMREYETKQEDREEGMEKGQLSTLSRLIKKGIITVKEAASELGVTERTFKKKMAML